MYRQMGRNQNNIVPPQVPINKIFLELTAVHSMMTGTNCKAVNK